MRVAIIGAGALGGTFAARLAAVGHDVTVTARGAGLAAIQADGIRLTGGFGEAHAHPIAVERLTERPELVLVCTKAQDAEAAIAANATVIDGAPVIVVQNGLGGVATARRLLPASDCFGALTIIAANYTKPGQVTVTTPALTYLGRGDGPADAATRRWQALLEPAVPAAVIDNFVGAQWTKLVVNMLNALPAITGLSVQEVVADPGLRLVMTASMRETVRVGMARGVRFGSLQALGDRRLRAFSRLPLWAGQVLPLMMRARMGDVPNLGSTLQSIRRGQPTEIDFLNGAVVREAAEAGVPVPVNVHLTALVHEVEGVGTPLPVAEVLRRFAASPAPH
ncbi:ketopantoate reductase family protein [Cryobacterium tepidiphilum]|uniref:2-dehydropantoate 2-reductase n=1 Tax=Cryobacterium tepidiphilum TaxID=2486026 RepID=A0A3M8LDZ1_9MICO|nr:ketopantoate reductase family protein [Cryobacterium tepidiphilum]RNE63696.1 ketopantoate reductase family protein [Cryobacterium tepidiphilum]